MLRAQEARRLGSISDEVHQDWTYRHLDGWPLRGEEGARGPAFSEMSLYQVRMETLSTYGLRTLI